MVLSNYKCMHIRIQGSWILIQGLQTYSSNVSSNRIKIQEILLILQIETDYFSKLFISEMLHSKQWYYSLHKDFQNCYSTRRSLTRFFSSNSSSNSSSNATRAHYTTIQRILHPESNSTYRRQRALRVLQSRNASVCLIWHSRQLQLLQRHSRHSSHSWPSSLPGNSTMFQYLQGIHPIPAFPD